MNVCILIWDIIHPMTLRNNKSARKKLSTKAVQDQAADDGN